MPTVSADERGIHIPLKTAYVTLAMVALFMSAGVAHAGSSRTVEGLNTMDYKTIEGFSTGVYGYEVAACDNGGNTLTFRIHGHNPWT